jgi:predicted glycosyltransferase
MTVRRLEPAPSAPRIALYSHDTVGLGHTRRNLAVADSMITSWPDADVLLITGNPEATALPRPVRTDVVTLPTLAKGADGRYRSRTLGAPYGDVLAMRSAVVEAAVTSFAPDLLIIDKVPLGVDGELLPLLRRLRTESGTTIVLGLREILDDPVATVAEWNRDRTGESIARYFDAVWVYGDRRVFDPVLEYGLPPEVADRVSYTGYLGADRFAGSTGGEPTPVPAEPYVLCTVGGGQDGAELARLFASVPPPCGHRGLVVCGPYMSAAGQAAVRDAAAGTPGMQVLDFVPDLHRLIARAGAVVSMAGYNSVCEVLATDRPALLVPRTRPRAEQLLRAERLAELGAADQLPLDRLDRHRLAAWCAGAVAESTATVTATARAALDLDGLARIPGLARRLLTETSLRCRQEVGHAA